MALEIKDSTIDAVLGEKEITVIDFWASWCGPCKMIGPIIDELSSENSDVTIGKVDVTDNVESAQKYMITGIPCIVFFKNGEEVHRIKGVVAKKILQEKINSLKG